MIAELNGETKVVLRHRRGVMWCPFCDRSKQDEGSEQYCDGGYAKFTDEAAEVPVVAEAPATPRRRRAAEEPVAEAVVEEVAEEA